MSRVDIRKLYLGIIEGQEGVDWANNERMIRLLSARGREKLEAKFFGDRAFEAGEDDDDSHRLALEAVRKICTLAERSRDTPCGEFPISLKQAEARDGVSVLDRDVGRATDEEITSQGGFLLDLSSETISAAMKFHCSGLPGEAIVINRKSIDGLLYPRSMRDVARVIDAMQKPGQGDDSPIISFPYFDEKGFAVAVTIDTKTGLVLFNNSHFNPEYRSKVFADFKDRFTREVVPSLSKKFGHQKAEWEIGIQEVPLVKSSVYYDYHTSSIHCILNAALDLLRIQYHRSNGDNMSDGDFLLKAKEKIRQITCVEVPSDFANSIDDMLGWVSNNVFESEVRDDGERRSSADIRNGYLNNDYGGRELSEGGRILVRQALFRKQILQKMAIIFAEVTKQRGTLYADSGPLGLSERGPTVIKDRDAIDGVAPGLDPASYEGYDLGNDQEYHHLSDFEMAKEVFRCSGDLFSRQYQEKTKELKATVEEGRPKRDGSTKVPSREEFDKAVKDRDNYINRAFIFSLVYNAYQKAEEWQQSLAAQAKIDLSFPLCDDQGEPLADRGAVNKFFSERVLQFVPEQYRKDAERAIKLVLPKIKSRWNKGLSGQDVDNFVQELLAEAQTKGFVPNSSCSQEFLDRSNDVEDLEKKLVDRLQTVVGGLGGGHDFKELGPRQIINSYFHKISELAALGLIRPGWAVNMDDSANSPIVGINPLDGVPFCVPKNDGRNFTIIVLDGEEGFIEKMIRFETNGDVLLLDISDNGNPNFTSAEEVLLEQIGAIALNRDYAQSLRSEFIHQRSGREEVSAVDGMKVKLSVAADDSSAPDPKRERRLESVSAPAILPSDAIFSSPGLGEKTTLTVGRRRSKKEAKPDRDASLETEKIVVCNNDFKLRAGSFAEGNRHLLRNSEFLRVIFDGIANGPIDFGNADLSYASFRGCEFRGKIDLSKIPPEVFRTLSFTNCKGLENIVCPPGLRLVEKAIDRPSKERLSKERFSEAIARFSEEHHFLPEGEKCAIVARAEDAPDAPPPSTAVMHPVAVELAVRRARGSGRGCGGMTRAVAQLRQSAPITVQ